MVSAVGSVYVACEIVGLMWRRDRPFTASTRSKNWWSTARAVVSVTSCGVRAGDGGNWRRRELRARSCHGQETAWLLGLSRVAVGLHYPSDVLAGAVLGSVIRSLLALPTQCVATLRTAAFSGRFTTSGPPGDQPLANQRLPQLRHAARVRIGVDQVRELLELDAIGGWKCA